MKWNSQYWKLTTIHVGIYCNVCMLLCLAIFCANFVTFQGLTIYYETYIKLLDLFQTVTWSLDWNLFCNRATCFIAHLNVSSTMSNGSHQDQFWSKHWTNGMCTVWKLWTSQFSLSVLEFYCILNVYLKTYVLADHHCRGRSKFFDSPNCLNFLQGVWRWSIGFIIIRSSGVYSEIRLIFSCKSTGYTDFLMPERLYVHLFIIFIFLEDNFCEMKCFVGTMRFSVKTISEYSVSRKIHMSKEVNNWRP